MASLKEQVLQGFKNAGLSLNQARILAAEVGRENSFDPNVIFGVHSDPENKKTNVGMLSWQNGREVPLLNSLKSNGLIENGKIKQGQKAIDLMARYAVHEIRTKPEYAETKKQFLDNPNVPYKDAVKVLGRNFIRWRFDDPEYASGHTNRDEFYSQLGGNPARQEYQDRSAQIVAAYKAKQKEQERKAQAPKDTGRTQKIVAAYQKARQDGRIQDATNQPQGLPDFDAQGNIIQPTTEQQPQSQRKTTLGQDIIGAGETALTLGTGAIAAPIASVVGTLGQAGREIVGGEFGSPEAAQRIALAAQQAGQDYTYQPRSQAGREQLQAVGEALSPLESLPPVVGGLGIQTATLGKAAIPQSVVAAQRTGQAVAPLVEKATQAAQRPIQAVTNTVRTGAQSVREAVGMGRATDNPAPANIGAAETGQEQIRRNLFQEFDVPATNPQITRSPEQLKDFYEIIRGGGEAGQLLRDRIEEQSRAVETALHKAIDDTGAKASDVYTTGENITKALENQMNVESVNVRKKYAAADASKEASRKVDISAPVQWTKQELADAEDAGISLDQGNVIDLINQNQGLQSTGVYADARILAIKRGIADVDSDGNLIAKTGERAPNLKQIEEWRKEIRSTINQNENADIAAGTRIINMIDNATSRVEGNLYKEARKARYDYAKRWETRSIITDLVKNKKNSDDRKVAIENIVDRITSTKTSKEDIAFIRKIMNESGEDGRQAWKDTQGTIINNIRDQAFSGVQDTRGNETLLASKMDAIVKKLDAAGKLDDIFDKPQAERLRGLNELTKTMLTLPPQVGINWSNTAKAVLAGIADLVLFGMTGMPPVVASALRLAVKHIQDRKALIQAKRMLDVNLPKGKSI